MPNFIKLDRIAVSDGSGNTVFIRRKMDLGAVSRIQGAKDGMGLVALYVANILAWDGPDFKGLDCTPEVIATIDPNDPFWVTVADKIAELNVKVDSGPLGNGAASNGTITGEAAAVTATSATST